MAAKSNTKKKNTRPENDFLFDRNKYKILIGGLLVTALGFILMVGGGSKDPNQFSDEIFNFQRITLAPFLVLLGYAIQIYGILKKRKDHKTEE